MKQTSFLVFGILIVLGTLIFAGCVQEQSDDVIKGGEPLPVVGMLEISVIPPEHAIYLDYFDTIGLVGYPYDKGEVEATVMSITNSKVCPYDEEECSIDPYPKDIGIVRIDKIIDYSPYIPYSEPPVVEGPAEPGKQSGDNKPTPSYRGAITPIPKKQQPTYNPLKEGQDVSTIFILTTQPSKIRYMTVYELRGGPEGDFLPGPLPGSVENDDIISKEIETGQATVTTVSINVSELPGKTYEPIPKEENYFVFTTKIFYSEVEEAPVPEPEVTTEKILSGLKVGDTFRAKINYDGTLYVDEYEII